MWVLVTAAVPVVVVVVVVSVAVVALSGVVASGEVAAAASKGGHRVRTCHPIYALYSMKLVIRSIAAYE